MEPSPFDISTSVTYVRSARARRLRITIRPEMTVTVTVPRRVSLEEAARFAASHEGWMRKHLVRMAERQKKLEQEPPPPLPDLSKIDLAAAQDEIFERLAALSKEHKLPYQQATFRCQKSKWGSCSSHNNISLNINMIFLPRHLQDYLLLHELTHIRHKNHSVRFWAELARLSGGNPKALAKELKHYKIHLFR